MTKYKTEERNEKEKKEKEKKKFKNKNEKIATKYDDVFVFRFCGFYFFEGVNGFLWGLNNFWTFCTQGFLFS